MDELRLDLQGCLEAAACCAMGMPCHGGFPLAVSSAAFLRDSVLIPGGVGLNPGLTAEPRLSACPLGGLAPTQLQAADL